MGRDRRAEATRRRGRNAFSWISRKLPVRFKSALIIFDAHFDYATFGYVDLKIFEKKIFWTLTNFRMVEIAGPRRRVDAAGSLFPELLENRWSDLKVPLLHSMHHSIM